MSNFESNERKFGDFSRFTNRIKGNIKDNYGTGYDALKEISNCKKTTHWMWYIFPQLHNLGTSEFTQYYGLKNIREAKEYINNQITGKYLVYITRKALVCMKDKNKTLHEVFGPIDKNKFLSCMTLFYYATLGTELNKLFDACKYFAEEDLKQQDKKTIEMCEKELANKKGEKIKF